MEINDGCELLIDLLQGALEEEGYITKRYSDTTEFYTTAYDELVVKIHNGRVFQLSIVEKEDCKNPYTGKISKKDEVFTSKNIGERVEF